MWLAARLLAAVWLQPVIVRCHVVASEAIMLCQVIQASIGGGLMMSNERSGQVQMDVWDGWEGKVGSMAQSASTRGKRL